MKPQASLLAFSINFLIARMKVTNTMIFCACKKLVDKNKGKRYLNI